MAALVRFSVLAKQPNQRIPINTVFRHSTQRFTGHTNVKIGPQIDSVAKSLASKGYLRAQRPYQPPENVSQKVRELYSELKLAEIGCLSMNEKYTILTKCSEAFKHSVPNSMLHEINSIENIIAFYETPIDTTLPLDAIKTMKLPPNLHIQTEPLRFDPATDTLFGGKTAFPRSSTIVTGLRAKNKYKGHIVKSSWP